MTIFLSDIYDIGSRGNLRGKAKTHVDRPTIGEHFMSDRDYTSELVLTLPSASGIVSATNVAQNDEILVNHTGNKLSTKTINILEYLGAGGSGLVENTLDFDLIDESKFIQEDSVSGTVFFNGKVGLCTATRQSYTTLDPSLVPVEGNLSNNDLTYFNGATSWGTMMTTEAFTGTGKHYFEFEYTNSPGYGCFFGVTNLAPADAPTYWGGTFLYLSSGGLYLGGALYGSSYPTLITGDVIGIALDMTALTLKFYKNNVLVDQMPVTGTEFRPHISTYQNQTVTLVVDPTLMTYSQTGYISGGPLGDTTQAYTTDTPYYITTSDQNQLSVASVDAFNSLVVTATTPANTSIKSLVSFDGRTTWLKANTEISFLAAKWNSAWLDAAVTLTNNDLTFKATGWNGLRTLHSENTGKYYFEYYMDNCIVYGTFVGVSRVTADHVGGYGQPGVLYLSDGEIYVDGVSLGYVASAITSGDTIGVALDCDAGTIKFFKNNVFQYTVNSTIGASYSASAYSNNNETFTLVPDPADMLYSVDGYTSGFGQTVVTSSSPVFIEHIGGLSNLQTGSSLLELQTAFTDFTKPTEVVTLDFAFDLSTSTASDTPLIDQITINYDEFAGGWVTADEEDYSVENMGFTQTKATKLSPGTISEVKVRYSINGADYPTISG